MSADRQADGEPLGKARGTTEDCSRACRGPITTGPQEEAGSARVIAIDVSLSMSGALDSADFAKILALLAVSHVGTVALIDSEVRGMYPLESAHEAVRATTRGSSTDLASPLQTLLEKYSSVLLVTDVEGLTHIRNFRTWRIMAPIIGSVALEIVDVMREKQ
jgi:predicted metal-dependent peptidase